MKKLGIHIFRRDLRLEDNTALNALFETVDEVLPVFIFDERQTNKHEYQSVPGLQMLCEAVEELDAALKEKGSELHIQTGRADDVLLRLINNYAPAVVSWNKDYTPFSIKRDEELRALLNRHGISCIEKDDVTLHAPGTVLTKEGKPYSVYTHYRIAAESLARPEPVPLKKDATFDRHEGGEDMSTICAQLIEEKRTLLTEGGRSVALELLEDLKENKTYAADRDYPSIEGTSLLSAHIKFGTVSIREVYDYAKKNMPNPTTYLRELLWHDFFTTIAALSPHVYQGAYKKEYDALKWSTDTEAFERWKTGNTGFPIVDAGMRELLHTGYMHNRVRMIVASFLIKDLHINWQWGEKHFAQHLTDYDPAVNNGNWQWVAGTGCDASPWFRIFNPWIQQEKFDSNALYIKTWIPELKDLPAKEIHAPQSDKRAETGYPAPMCDHKEEAAETKRRYNVIKE